MESGIAILFGTFLVLSSYKVYNKLFVYKDRTHSIEKITSSDYAIDPHLANKSYYGRSQFLDGYYDKVMQNIGKKDDLRYVKNVFDKNYNEYRNKITDAVYDDSIRKEQNDIDFNKFANSNKPVYDPKDITNYVDTQRFKYQFPIEDGVEYINDKLSKIMSRGNFPLPQNNF